MQSGFSEREWSERERDSKMEATVFLYSNLKSDILSLLPHAIGHIDQLWYTVGRDNTKLWIPGGTDNSESS